MDARTRGGFLALSLMVACSNNTAGGVQGGGAVSGDVEVPGDAADVALVIEGDPSPCGSGYRHAYFGIDVDCDDVPDGALDYARGDRVPLDESALNEADGVCGKFWIDWNKDGSVTPTVKKNLNLDYDPTCGSGAYGAMTDFDDWGALVFCGVTSGVVPATGTGRKAAVCYDDAESVGKRMRR